MIKGLNKQYAKQYSIDYTIRIIPNCYKPYKLMTIYSNNNMNNIINITVLLCLKYNDSESLKKIFSKLNISYNFNQISINTDFDSAQI